MIRPCFGVGTGYAPRRVKRWILGVAAALCLAVAAGLFVGAMLLKKQETGRWEVPTPKEVVDGQTFTNWDPYANEPMTLRTALAASCDTYFYQVALRFYNRTDSPLQRWAQTMGFGARTGVDIGPEEAGLIPTPAWRRRYFKTEIDKIWTSGDSVQLSTICGRIWLFSSVPKSVS